MNWELIFNLIEIITMKSNKIFKLLPLLLFLILGCDGEEKNSVDMSQIKQVSDFVDERDGHIYRCVQIGNQIWMMDNLNYFLEGGASEGCYTWEQKYLDLSNITIDVMTFYTLYNSVVDDPSHDWQTETGANAAMLKQFLNFYLQGMYTQEAFVAMLSYYKAFHTALVEEMDEYKENAKIILATNARDKAEKMNGDYSKTYGYLYSLEGARKATPEGWRIPSDKDWMMLEVALGMPSSELEVINGWRGENCGNFLKEGGAALFEAKMAGCDAYSASEYLWIRFLECGYFWTNDEWQTIETSGSTDTENNVQEVAKEGMIRQVAIYSSKIWRGTTRLKNNQREVAYSVRCVKDAQ